MRNLLFLLFLGTLMACNDPNVVLDQNLPMEESEWNYRDNPSFTVNITDTNATYAAYVNIRFEANYQYSNLFFLLHTIMPDGTRKQDRIECELFDQEGLPIGKGLGDLFFIRYRIPKLTRFHQLGKYEFTMEQNMRIDHLSGIHDMGLWIQKTTTP